MGVHICGQRLRGQMPSTPSPDLLAQWPNFYSSLRLLSPLFLTPSSPFPGRHEFDCPAGLEA